MVVLHPDGDYTEEERARGLVLGPQQYDGHSRISGLITPELRALIEALWAKLAAPGADNPADHKPVLDGAPDEHTAGRRISKPQPGGPPAPPAAPASHCPP